MDVADKLIDMILSLVDLQEESVDELYTLADELEEHKKNINISKVTGSSAAVGGAAAMTAAGVTAICTGGAAIPVLAVVGTVGAVISGLGAATSIGAEGVGAIVSSHTMKKAKLISEKIQKLEERIQELIELLIMEGKRLEQQAASRYDVSPEDYVVERILRAMARREGLMFNDEINLYDMMSVLSKKKISGKETAFGLLAVSLQGLALLSKFIIEAAAKKSGKLLMTKGLEKMVISVGTKAAAEAVGHVAGGAVGLLFSVPELIFNIKDLVEDNSETEVSQSLREHAKALLAASKAMKKDLDEIQKAFERLARVQLAVQNTNRDNDDKKIIMEFVIKSCEDEAALRWLRENLKSDTFFQLVDMFLFLKKHMDEEEQKDHSNSVDITFVAHGSIRDFMIPASCLLPLPSIKDVILYSPWNCAISSDVAYGIATGRLEPQHRVFCCRKKTNCQIPDEEHQPTKLPNDWNSMKEAGHEKIPNIILSPLKPPEDGAWERFVVLKNEYGQPERNRIIIPFLLPAENTSLQSVPFSIITQALSVRLMLSRFKATIHLTACLGDRSAGKKFNQEYLKHQYACTINNTAMTCSPDMLSVNQNVQLRENLKCVFD